MVAPRDLKSSTRSTWFLPSLVVLCVCIISAIGWIVWDRPGKRISIHQYKPTEDSPCWSGASRLTPSGVYKCHQGGSNHTIATHTELSFQGGDYNMPWFYAPSKVALCWMPKVGCTKTKLVWAHLTGVIREQAIHDHHPPSVHPSRFAIDDLNYIFNNDDWLKIIVVRDPVERFISGYIDKVWQTGWFNKERKNFNLTAASVLTFLKRNDTMNSDHFARQSEYCNVKNLGSAWNRLVIYSRYGMAEKLSQASDHRLDVVLNGSGLPSSAGPIFGSGTGHQTATSTEHDILMKELCCWENGRVLDELKLYFAEDYGRFPFQADWGGKALLCKDILCI